MVTFTGPGTGSYTPDSSFTGVVKLSGAGGGTGGGASSGQGGGAGGAGGYAEFEFSFSAGQTYDYHLADTGQGGSTASFDASTSGGSGGSGVVSGASGGDGFDGAGSGGGGGGSSHFLDPSDNLIADAGGGGGGSGANGGNDTDETGGGGGGAESGAGGTGDGPSSADGGTASGDGDPAGGDGGNAPTANFTDGNPGGGGSAGVAQGSNVTTTVGGGNTGAATLEIITPPSAPASASQTIDGDEQITVSWDDVSSEDNYRLEVSEDGGSYSTVATPSADTTSYVYTATASVDTHRFRVRAENTAGSSSWTYTSTKSTQASSLSATVVTAGQVDLSWSQADDENGYDVLRSESSGTTTSDYTEIATGLAAGTESYSDTTVSSGVTYYYRVETNYGGTNSLSNEASATPDLEPPTLDSLDASVEREVTVNYTLNDDSNDGDVLIERSTDGGSTFTDAGTVTDLTKTSFTDTGLNDGEQYTYRVTRRTPDDTASSGTKSTVTILPAPTDLAAADITADQVDVSWTVNHNYGDQRVEYRRSSATSWTTWSTPARSTTNESIAGLLNGEEYDIRVLAVTEHTETVDA